jgi:hypothetical protein
MNAYVFDATLWIHSGGSWHFVTLPFDVADEIDELTSETKRGFGSSRVKVTIGATTWNTSIFPDTKAESYVLPVKQPVRKAEQLAAGETYRVMLQLVD